MPPEVNPFMKCCNVRPLSAGLNDVIPAHFEAGRLLVSHFEIAFPLATILVSYRANFYITDPSNAANIKTISQLGVFYD